MCNPPLKKPIKWYDPPFVYFHRWPSPPRSQPYPTEKKRTFPYAQGKEGNKLNQALSKLLLIFQLPGEVIQKPSSKTSLLNL